MAKKEKKPPDTQRVRNARRALRRELRAVRESNEKETARTTGDGLAAAPGEQAEDKRIHFKFTPDQIANAKLVAAAAKDWAKANPDAYGYMKRHAISDANANRRVSVSALVHDARRIDFCDTSGKKTTISNNITSALARMLVRDVPGIAEHVEFRRCAVGAVMAEESGEERGTE